MKEFLKYSCFLLAFIVCFSSCKDDSANTEDVVTQEEIKNEKIEMLAGTEGKSWVLVSATSFLGDVTGFFRPCELDNIFRLYPEGTGEYRSGEVKCEDNEPEIINTGNWELSENGETLSLNMGWIDNNAKIVELTENLLRLEVNFQGQKINTTFNPAP